MQQQSSDISDNGMAWSVVTSGPYMQMLSNVRLDVLSLLNLLM